MTDTSATDQYAGFLPPFFRDRPDAEDVMIRTWQVGDPLGDHDVPELPAPIAMFFDLVAAAAERAGSNGFAHLWLDRHPHEQPGWRLSVGHVGSADELDAAAQVAEHSRVASDELVPELVAKTVALPSITSRADADSELVAKTVAAPEASIAPDAEMVEEATAVAVA